MTSRYVKQTLWRYRDELAHESHSQDVRGHFHCKQNANISIPTNIMTHIVCQNNCNIVCILHIDQPHYRYEDTGCFYYSCLKSYSKQLLLSWCFCDSVCCNYCIYIYQHCQYLFPVICIVPKPTHYAFIMPHATLQF